MNLQLYHYFRLEGLHALGDVVWLQHAYCAVKRQRGRKAPWIRCSLKIQAKGSKLCVQQGDEKYVDFCTYWHIAMNLLAVGCTRLLTTKLGLLRAFGTPQVDEDRDGMEVELWPHPLPRIKKLNE